MKSHFIQYLEHEIHVRTWGNKESFPLICWHGVSRNSGDFCFLAENLQDYFYIIAPDTPGRGLSQWEEDPKNYKLQNYAAIAIDIVDQFDLKEFAWLGTSMGGMLGLILAGTAFKEKITHLLLNDIGPSIKSDVLKRIGTYLGISQEFDNFDSYKEYLKQLHAGFGPLSDDEWIEIAKYSGRRNANGKITIHYDPAIAENFLSFQEDVDLWPIYQNIVARTLLIRGEISDVLSEETALEMTQIGPKAKLWTIFDAGHAPILHRKDEADFISNFILNG